MGQETILMARYFDALKRHDLEAVMACFDHEAVLVAAHGRRIEGADAIRDSYASTFAVFRDATCTIRSLVGAGGTGAVESQFTGTWVGAEHPVRLRGVEVLEFRGEKIIALRDYHNLWITRRIEVTRRMPVTPPSLQAHASLSSMVPGYGLEDRPTPDRY